MRPDGIIGTAIRSVKGPNEPQLASVEQFDVLDRGT
jgi:hypothetical protein